MTDIVTLKTLSGYSIDIGLDDPVYYETLLPIFDQLGVKMKFISLADKNLVSFQKELKRSLEYHIRHYKPRRGRGSTNNIFGTDYFLTFLDTEHKTISHLNDIYIATEHCIQNGIPLQFEYS